MKDEVVAIAATANSGYRFVSWTGAVSDPAAASTSVTVDADKTVTANFEAVPVYTLTVGANPAEGGSISPPAGDPSYNEGEVVAITATANSGYRFVSWSGEVADPAAATTTLPWMQPRP